MFRSELPPTNTRDYIAYTKPAVDESSSRNPRYPWNKRRLNKGKVGRPKKSITTEESNEDVLMGEEIEADGDKFFEEEIEKADGPHRRVRRSVKDGDDDV